MQGSPRTSLLSAPAHALHTAPEQDRRMGRWALLAGGALFAALLLGKADLLELAYPALTLFAGVLLYRHYPVTYVGYTWWLFFLTPEVRRLVDYQSGWSEISPIMLAPWLVAGLTTFGVFRPSSSVWSDYRMGPFWLVLAGISTGYGVGLLRNSFFAATYGTLIWATPVLFGIHVMQMRRQHTSGLRRVIERTFLWGTLVMGTYGIIQFFFVPPWDGAWILDSGMESIGVPRPQEVRVFSTLNSPGPFAAVLLAGLLLLFASRSRLRVPAGIAGYAAFLLSLVRTCWMGWIVGVLILLPQARQKQRRHLTVGLLVVGVAVGLMAVYTPLADDVVGQRLGTMGDIQQDGSFQARLAVMQRALELVFANPLGYGLGSVGLATNLTGETPMIFDTGLFQVPFELGWVGALLYAIGVGGLIWHGFWSSRAGGLFEAIAYGIAVSMVAQMLSGHALNNVSGMAAWTFFGIAVARVPDLLPHTEKETSLP